MSSRDNFIDESLVSTPQPKASSTISKKHKNVDRPRVKIPLNYSSVSEAEVSSLGALNPEDIEHSKHTPDGTDLMNRLKTQRKLAESLIERANKTAGLPSKYLKADGSLQKSTRTSYCAENSTVNESDLINRKESVNSQTFYPNDVSTPRTSNAAEKPLESFTIQSITEMSEKIRNSDISLRDICSELQRASLGRFSVPQVTGLDSQLFTAAELMSDKLLQDEMSWRRAKDVPFEKLHESISSVLGAEKPSMGEFFKIRSDLGDLFKANSPEKNFPPTPLIDVTNTSTFCHNNETHNIPKSTSRSESDIMSVTQIAKALSDLTCDTPKRIIDHLLKQGKSEKDCTRISKSYEKKSLPPNWDNLSPIPSTLKPTKENDCDEYIANKRSQQNSLSPSFAIPVPQPRSSMNNTESRNESKLRYERTLSTSPTPSVGKENKISPECQSRCPSSLDSIPEGKLPIKGNKLEIVWGCVKLGRSSTQSCCIRNQLNQKIRMQVLVTGSSFRIVKERGDTEMLTSMIFVMHPLETKSLSIMFYPTAIGAVYENLKFHPITKGEVLKNMQQTIKLYGYGGHAAIDISKVAKDSTGKLWLSLGLLLHKPEMTQQFTIKNNGVLSAFAMLELTNDSISNVKKVSVSPKEIVIKPEEEIVINLTYNPSKYDYKSQQEIIDVGSIKVIAGAEALRGRLKRLYTKLVQQNQPVDQFLMKISKRLPNEDMPSDLSTLKESTATVKELIEQLMIKEIRLTLEKDPDATLTGPMGDFEDTTMYQTLYQGCSSIYEPNDVPRESKTGQFRVEPNSIIFSLPYKKEDTVLLYSNASTPMAFEIKTTKGFSVRPSNGTISGSGVGVIHITCSEVPPSGNGKISIYLENELIEVNLKTVLIK